MRHAFVALQHQPITHSNQIKSNLYLNQAKAHTHRHTHAYTKHNNIQ